MGKIEVMISLNDQIKLSSLVANMKRAAQYVGSQKPGSLGDNLFSGALKLNLQLRNKNIDKIHVELCVSLINSFNVENAMLRNQKNETTAIKAVKYIVVSDDAIPIL